MARELVLIPKTKYEHLIKLSEDYKPDEQIGGQRDNTDLESPVLGTKNKNSEENQMSSGGSKDENQVSSDSKDRNEPSTEEKPRLYVDKPLSKMPFDRIKSKSPTKRRKKGAKTNIDIRLLNEEKTKSAKFSRKKRIQSKGNTKGAKWINYVI